NHCFRRTASWSIAEDLTSSVFLETWKKRDHVTIYGDSLLPWLLSVANNLIRNSNRSFRRNERLLLKLKGHAGTSEPELDLDSRLDDERKMIQILGVLDGLRTEDKELISLCDWSGLSY